MYIQKSLVNKSLITPLFNYIILFVFMQAALINLTSCTYKTTSRTILPNNLSALSSYNAKNTEYPTEFYHSPDSTYVLVKYYQEPEWSFGTGTTILGLYFNDILQTEHCFGESFFYQGLRWVSNVNIKCTIHCKNEEERQKVILYNHNQPVLHLSQNVLLTFDYYYWQVILSKLYNAKYNSKTKQSDIFFEGWGGYPDSIDKYSVKGTSKFIYIKHPNDGRIDWVTIIVDSDTIYDGTINSLNK